jgi:hypothetical protein
MAHGRQDGCTSHALHRTRIVRVPENFNALVYLASGFVKKRVVASRAKCRRASVPKLLVVFSSVDSYAARMADVVALGAKTVRFTEVDVRAVTDANGEVSGRRRLESFDALREYHGVVLTAPGPESTRHELAGLLRSVERDASLADTVFGIAGAENAEMLLAIARCGGLIVGQLQNGEAEARARALGARVATVIGWVHHALSHEAEHAANHQHVHHHHGT